MCLSRFHSQCFMAAIFCGVSGLSLLAARKKSPGVYPDHRSTISPHAIIMHHEMNIIVMPIRNVSHRQHIFFAASPCLISDALCRGSLFVKK